MRYAMLKYPITAMRRLSMRVKGFRARSLRGPVLALLGPDGSGKTSTLNELQRLVENDLRWPAKTIYMGPWGHDRFAITSKLRYHPPPTLSALLNERRGTINSAHVVPTMSDVFAMEWRRLTGRTRLTEAPFRLLARKTNLLWVAFQWLRAHVRYWAFLAMILIELSARYRQVRRESRNGVMVICDRYPFDLMVGEMHAVNPRYSWARFLICTIFPKPDVSVLLWAETATLLSRKQQLAPDVLREIQGIYAAMETRWGFDRVMTDVAPSEVAHNILTRTFLRLLAARLP